MRKYNINESIIHVVENVYIYTTRSDVQFCSMAVVKAGSELLLGLTKLVIIWKTQGVPQ